MPTADSFRYEFDFTPTRRDYVEMFRHAPGHLALRILAWSLLGTALLGALASSFLVDAAGRPFGDPSLSVLILMALPLALVGIGFPQIGAAVAWRKPMNREPIHAVLDADGFSHAGPSGAQSATWRIISRVLETTDAYYLYCPTGLFTLVFWLPKRAVRADELSSLSQQLRAHVTHFRRR